MPAKPTHSVTGTETAFPVSASPTVFAVSLPRDVAVKLSRGGAVSADKLGSLVGELLTEIAEGGLLVDHFSMARIGAVANVTSGADLVPLVEAALHRRRGQVVAEYLLDPIWAKPLEAVAARRGQTLQQLVQDSMNQAFAMKFFYPDFIDRAVRPRALYFDQGELEQMAESLGKKNGELTGRDIAQFILGEFVLPAKSG